MTCGQGLNGHKALSIPHKLAQQQANRTAKTVPHTHKSKTVPETLQHTGASKTRLTTSPHARASSRSAQRLSPKTARAAAAATHCNILQHGVAVRNTLKPKLRASAQITRREHTPALLKQVRVRRGGCEGDEEVMEQEDSEKVCVRVFVCACVYVCVRERECVSACTFPCACVRVHVRVRVRARVRVRVCVCVRACVCVCALVWGG